MAVPMMHPLVRSASPGRLARPSRRDAAKRALDLTLVVAGLVAIWPLLLLIALAVRWDSPGPALFAQTRIGRDGRPFRMWKFRSMRADAEVLRPVVLGASDRAGLCFKAKDDPRVTRLGRLLRRTSLDELPQLWNILRGEMSLVGPRPALPEEVAAYPAHARGRLAVRPGLTGVWQVSGRADVGFDAMIAMDLDYVRDHGLRRDIGLILATFRAVLAGRGAY
jgi:lipopolysaccharide/colanic/teichoic acid biosynthesis glycosyltransferase